MGRSTKRVIKRRGKRSNGVFNGSAGKQAQHKSTATAKDSKTRQGKKKKNVLEKHLSVLSANELRMVTSQYGLLELLRQENLSTKKVVRAYEYEVELEKLQIELVKLQRTVQLSGRRIAILFEGRDAAGKGGSARSTNERKSAGTCTPSTSSACSARHTPRSAHG